MNRKDLYNSFSDVDADILERSEATTKGNSPHNWQKWGALAACLCLILAVVFPLLRPQQGEPPHDTIEPGDGPPSLIVNGITYYVSPYPGASETLPDGFTPAGSANIGGIDCPYYTNPDIPEWVYVYHEVTTDGTVDESGTLNRTDPHGAYVRYVDVRLRGKRLICYQGAYYIFLPSAETYGSYPDVTHEYWNEMASAYDGGRVDGNLPEGFVSVGIAEFSGHDTIPRGDLVSNQGDDEVFANPNVPDVVFVSSLWHTDGKDWKFDVYIRYDFPFA